MPEEIYICKACSVLNKDIKDDEKLRDVITTSEDCLLCERKCEVHKKGDN